MKKTIIIVSLLVVGLAGGWLVLKNHRTALPPVQNGDDSSITTKQTTNRQPSGGTNDGTAMLISTTATNAQREWEDFDLVGDPNLSDADKQLIKKLQAALDEEDLKGVTEAARQLMHSKSEAARLRLASALGWFGAAALPELLELMGDASQEVADAALSPTLEAIREMDDGEDKANLIAAFAESIRDLDALDEALMLFAGIDDEIVIPLLERLIAAAQGDPARLAVLKDYLAFLGIGDFAS